MVKPESITKDIEEEVDDHGMLNIGFSDVKAVGRYVVVNFPSSGR
jgi:sporulation protein YlmC with PRC-barrel domain